MNNLIKLQPKCKEEKIKRNYNLVKWLPQQQEVFRASGFNRFNDEHIIIIQIWFSFFCFSNLKNIAYCFIKHYKCWILMVK